MAETLRDIIETVYSIDYTHARVANYRKIGVRENNPIKYMEIPINAPVFEIPVFAFSLFSNLVNTSNRECLCKDAIVVKLTTEDIKCRYKSLDAIIRSVLKESFRQGLTRIEIGIGSNMKVYYASHGAIFDNKFKPILMFSWQIERCKQLTRKGIECTYFLKRPILRIDPIVFVQREDSMERYIANKIPFTCLEDTVYFPYVRSIKVKASDIDNRATRTVKIEIDSNPFHLKDANIPSVLINEKELLKLAADHIDDII